MKFIRNIALLLALVMLGAGIGALILTRAGEPYRGFVGTEQFVDLPSGAGSRTIGERLVAGGVVRDMITFRVALWRSGQGRRLKAGEYRFDRAMTPAEIIDKIARGDVFVIPVTFPEGLTIDEMAAIFESHGFGPASSFVAAARDATPIRALDPSATDLEGYLFPDTYPLPRHTDAAKLVRQMVARFEREMTPEVRRGAGARNLTVRQVVTLASIVEKETARPDERRLVASVYETRLRIGMALQCDPTVIYALTRAGRYAGNLTRENMAFESAYNTYRHAGLPPGPIASPGRASLEAVIHPADADYLYFVSRNDGSHEFARTLDEHNRNVQKYQVQYFKDKKAGRAGYSAGAGKSGRPH